MDVVVVIVDVEDVREAVMVNAVAVVVVADVVVVAMQVDVGVDVVMRIRSGCL